MDDLALTESLGEECNTLASDGVVHPLPVEDTLKVALRGERLDDHLDLEVGDLRQVLVTGQVAILADDDDALSQQIGVDSSLLGFAHKYHASSFSRVMIYIQ